MNPKPSLEEKLNQLKDIAQQFETGQVSLDESPAKYERALQLSQAIKTQLNSLQNKINRLKDQYQPDSD